MATIVVGIHGLSNKPEKKVLTDYWEKSIREGLAKNEKIKDPALSFHMVYWADLLYAQQLHRKPNFHFDPLYNDQPYIEAARGALKTHRDNWIDSARNLGGSLVGSLADLTHEMFGTDALPKLIIDKLLRDLSFYYDPHQKIENRKKKLQLARRVLMDELKNTLLKLKKKDDDVIVLVAHSMGSIIAYDVLREIGREKKTFAIDHFVTIGSPLGLPTVKANVLEFNRMNLKRPKDDWVRTPTVVTGSWKNYSDRRDLVCLDTHLSGDYEPNARGVEVEDDIVNNDYRGERNDDGKFAKTRKEAKANPHKSYGYLRTPEFSKFLANCLR